MTFLTRDFFLSVNIFLSYYLILNLLFNIKLNINQYLYFILYNKIKNLIY